ncbi:MAG TPA: prephenate dehydratase [Verrucomicrobia bacterium]|nr:MAG: prephenate dehydratase [Lentisphaerae bacterium GWF2_57_35]HBA86238.1 prephenate dehydratase [Verrucomicrobiota bacterium]
MNNDLTQRIDALDAELIRLLNERTKVALEMGRDAVGMAREEDVLRRLGKAPEGLLKEESLRAIYREITSAALSLERNVRIAFLGPEATFTHQAARARFGASVEYVPADTITEVFTFVQKKTATFGVVPIENSTEGAVTHTLDEFMSTPLKICAEIFLPIAQNLLAKCSMQEIQRVYSHPNVFGQCRRWLHENLPGVQLIPVSSTTKAAELAVSEPGSAAMAATLAGELYGLNVLAENIQDSGGNTTRFLVVARDYSPSTGQDKTSIFFGVKHKVGALYDALSAFKKYSLNMTKIESRPSKTKAWEYYFFVDFEGHAGDEVVQKALAELSEHCTLMTVLGSYPKASGTEA